MNILIRADAGIPIGSGHVMRCLALAHALREQGGNITFACRPHPGNLTDRIQQDGYRAITLPNVEAPGADPTSWAGASSTQDAADVLATTKDLERPDWVIVDHYALDHTWEHAIRATGLRVLAIEDDATRLHDADLVLNQNYDAAANPGSHRSLLGPTYALLRPEFRDIRQHTRPRDGTVNRILISFGGIDEQGLTLRTLQALETTALRALHLDIVIGQAHPHLHEVQDFRSKTHTVALHIQTTTMHTLMQHADLAIGASGTTSWERFCLGTPSLVIAAAPNQEPTAEALARDNLIHYLGTANTTTLEQLASAISQLLAHPEELRRLSRAGMSIVDGEGAYRVATALEHERSGPHPHRHRNRHNRQDRNKHASEVQDAIGSTVVDYRLRPVEPRDLDLILEWRNRPEIRSNMYTSRIITREEHYNYFERVWDDPTKQYFLCVDSADAPTRRGEPIGDRPHESHRVLGLLQAPISPKRTRHNYGIPRA